MKEINLPKKRALAAALAPFILGVAASANAQLATEATGGVPDSAVRGDIGIVLFDQTAGSTGNGAPNQDFEDAFDAYDNEAADDFVVNAVEGWQVLSVSTVGTQSTGGTPASVSITFYGDNGGTPDTDNVVCQFLNLPTVQEDGTGNLTTALPAGGCTLPSDGTTVYWMSEVVTQDFGGNGQRFWTGALPLNGVATHWRNPGDGFGSGCLDFALQGSVCGVGGGVDEDRLFLLEGLIAAGDPVAVPTLGMKGLLGLGFGLGMLGLLAVSRRRA